MANEVQIVVTSKDKTNFEAPRRGVESYSKSVDDLGEKADKGEMRMLGLKDTVDGVTTIMQGPAKAGIGAYIQGWADLAGGMANFVIPVIGQLSKQIFFNAVATVRNTAATVASRTATIAATAATKAMTIAQRALNLVMRANPIGIIITVIALVVVALVRWYKTSQRARDIINGVFRAIREGAQRLLSGLRATWETIRGIWQRVSSAVAAAARRGFLGPIPLIVSRWREVVEFFKKLPGRLASALSGLGRALIDKFSGAVKRVLEFLGIRSPSKVFEDIGVNLVEGLAVGIAGRMKKIPNLLGSLAAMAGGIFGGGGGGGSAAGLVGFAASAFEQFRRMFPSMTIGGWRARGSVPGSDHPKGKALDLMTGMGHVAAQIISLFLGQPGAKYWIWNRQIASAPGWQPRAYSGPSPHTDHVHLSYYRQGTSYVPSDRLAFLHRGEAVIPARENIRRGGGPVVFEIHSGGTRLDDLLVEIIRRSVRVRGGNVQTVFGR